jgi:hypothetical protein
MMRSLKVSWVWPALILLSVAMVGLAVFVFPMLPMRPLIVFLFLFISPGAALVRFLDVREPVSVGTLAVAISLSLDALIAGCQLYAGHWSPGLTLVIVMVLTVACLLIQLLNARKRGYS